MADETLSLRPRLLVVDDDQALGPLLERFARGLGFDVTFRTSGFEALSMLGELKPDVVLVDLRMPELSGLDVLRAIRTADPDCQVILMTGYASVDTAIEAVKNGALDYVSKPFDFERLEALLVGVREAREDREALLQADAAAAERLDFHGLIGRSSAMQQVFALIRRLAPHVRTVLITGETGTGKELVARALHREGPRHDKRFLTVNCSAVVEALFESELFGHVRGSFTGAGETKIGMFEHAAGGTLFLDEVGELPLAMQPKLLRAVEYGEVQRVGALDSRRVDVCVIGATNRDLRAEVEAGRFRADLFYRLGIVDIHLPPLRERREDIPYLTATFVAEFAERFRREIRGVTASAEQALQQHRWPGNIRELRNVIERACMLANGPLLNERDFSAAMSSAASPAPVPDADAEAAPSERLAEAQRERIRQAIASTRGNKAAAAKVLGMSRRSLYRWMDRLDM